MTELKEKVQSGLDENRMLVLGLQVLIGIDYRMALQPAFEALARPLQLAKLLSLGLLLFTFALLLTPGAHHRIVERGQDTNRLQRFTSLIASLALLPFALAIGLELAVSLTRAMSLRHAVAAGVAGSAVALTLWYGIELFGRLHFSVEKRQMEEKPTLLKDKIRQVLTECRVVLPGAQALLGFQFATLFVEGFPKLPPASKAVHVVSLALVALATVILMTPAAWHRIVERGEDTERFHRFSTVMMLSSMVPLALGICGDFYVVLAKVLGSGPAPVVLAALMLAFFFGMWFVLSLARRPRARRALVGAGERSILA